MISIKELIGVLWYPCPKCKKEQCITEWGEKICQYEGCDGHKFVVEYNIETATMILEFIQKNKLTAIPIRESKPIQFKLQQVHVGWINVPQGI